MKTLLVLLFPCICIAQTQNTTNVGRCLASNHYKKTSVIGSTGNPDKDIKEQIIYKACSVCFTDDVFAIYIPELGTISFTIDPATLTNKPTENGMEENFMNAEDATTRAGDYIVDITYGNPKVVLFQEPRYGIVVEIKAPNWLGSPENSATGKVAFSGLKKQKNNKVSDSTKPSQHTDTHPTHNSSIIKYDYAPFVGNKDSINQYIKNNYFHSKYVQYNQRSQLEPIVDTAGRLLHFERVGGGRISDSLLNNLSTFIRNSSFRWIITKDSGNVIYKGGVLNIGIPDYH